MMRLLTRLMAALSPRGRERLGSFFGWLLCTLRIRRGVVMQNLALAFPEKSRGERLAIARATYRNLGRMVPEFLRTPNMTKEELERILVYDGFEIVERARAEGKGLIACTAHFGHFDLLAAVHAMKGFPMVIITRKMGRHRANDTWQEARANAGVRELVVKKGETLKAAIRALKSQAVLGYVIDQNQSKRRAIFPTFFGVPAATSPTPAVLALRTGAPVVFTVTVPLEDGRHRVVIEGPLRVSRTGDHERDVFAFMQDLNDRLERWVRRYPDRWYWLHRRWKTRPD
jgi:KDO2-lipid IV(A) lauroyltransferase